MLKTMVLILLLLAGPVHALEITKTSWRGHEVLLAKGNIIPGDAAKITVALKGIKPLPHGLPVILLEGRGGSVAEALKISNIFSQTPIHTVVPNGAKCASACASIVFISGKMRTIEEGGYIGQHSCSLNGVPVQECNEIIADHALAHGVSYGSIAAFVTYVPPKKILWFSRSEADCWGITRYGFERESNFQKSEPCYFKSVKGRYPAAQSAWRVDFYQNGYRAFLRPAADHTRELQLNVYCDERKSGQLFLSIEIAGPANTIKDVILRASLQAKPVSHSNLEFLTEQFDLGYSNVSIQIPHSDILNLLTKSNKLEFALFLRHPYKTISASSSLSGSRKALIFAANNCIGKSK